MSAAAPNELGLTEMEQAELRYLAKQPGLLWGGVYARGGDIVINRWEQLGLIEAVAMSYKVGKATYPGGYRITSKGRAVLARPSPRPQHYGE